MSRPQLTLIHGEASEYRDDLSSSKLDGLSEEAQRISRFVTSARGGDILLSRRFDERLKKLQISLGEVSTGLACELSSRTECDAKGERYQYFPLGIIEEAAIKRSASEIRKWAGSLWGTDIDVDFIKACAMRYHVGSIFGELLAEAYHLADLGVNNGFGVNMASPELVPERLKLVTARPRKGYLELSNVNPLIEYHRFISGVGLMTLRTVLAPVIDTSRPFASEADASELVYLLQKSRREVIQQSNVNTVEEHNIVDIGFAYAYSPEQLRAFIERLKPRNLFGESEPSMQAYLSDLEKDAAAVERN